MPTYEYDFGIVGLFKLLFKKKICPECGGKLERKTEKTYAGKKWTRVGPDRVYGDTYDMKMRYHCKNCGTVYHPKNL